MSIELFMLPFDLGIGKSFRRLRREQRLRKQRGKQKDKEHLESNIENTLTFMAEVSHKNPANPAVDNRN